jgi:hypothetical protein
MTKKQHDQSKTNLAGNKLYKGDKVEGYGANNAIEGRKIKFQGSMKLAVCGFPPVLNGGFMNFLQFYRFPLFLNGGFMNCRQLYELPPAL